MNYAAWRLGRLRSDFFLKPIAWASLLSEPNWPRTHSFMASTAL